MTIKERFDYACINISVLMLFGWCLMVILDADAVTCIHYLVATVLVYGVGYGISNDILWYFDK